MKRKRRSACFVAMATVILFLYLQPAGDNSRNEDTKTEYDPNMVLEYRKESGRLQEDLMPSNENYNSLERVMENVKEIPKPNIDSNDMLGLPGDDRRRWKDTTHMKDLSKELIKLRNSSVSTYHFSEELGRRGDFLQNDAATTSKRRLKVYIYELPKEFNIDIYKCVSPEKPMSSKCYRMWEKGFGVFLYKKGEFSIHNTHMFSLEVLLHNQLLQSKYVTHNPEEADLFYIPAYLSIQYFCNDKLHDIIEFSEKMFDVVKSLPYFKKGKPHLTALSKIEQENAMETFPLLQNKNYRNVTCIVIEKTAVEYFRTSLGLDDQKVLVAPYPSYVHLDPRLAVAQTISTPTLTSRRVFMLIASSDRRTNPFRNSIVDQFPRTVSDVSFQNYTTISPDVGSAQPLQVWLVTQECVGQQENYTIDWMQNSVFCLQPHGDSPTRKSFYDSILSGCIPVIFKFHAENVEYPFERVLNYSDFVVTIDAQRIVTNKELVVDILKTIPMSEVQRLHDNIKLVARKLQYSVLDSQGTGYEDLPYIDALDMIIEEARHIYSL